LTREERGTGRQAGRGEAGREREGRRSDTYFLLTERERETEREEEQAGRGEGERDRGRVWLAVAAERREEFKHHQKVRCRELTPWQGR
jgi:hypothetical protein